MISVVHGGKFLNYPNHDAFTWKWSKKNGNKSSFPFLFLAAGDEKVVLVWTNFEAK